MIEALSLPLLPGSTRSSPSTATSLTGTDRQRGTGFVEVWRCCLGTEPQVVGVAFRCGGHGELAAYLVRSPCLLRDNCARGRAPERRGRSSAARTIRRILLLVPRAAPAATESPTRGRLRRCSPTYAAPRRRAPAGGVVGGVAARELGHAVAAPRRIARSARRCECRAPHARPLPWRAEDDDVARLRWVAPPNPPPPQTAAAS